MIRYLKAVLKATAVVVGVSFFIGCITYLAIHHPDTAAALAFAGLLSSIIILLTGCFLEPKK